MAALNKVMVIGNLGRDPEIRQAGDAPVADFSVAVSEKFKGRDGSTQEKTEWVNVVCWRRLAEVARDYLRKGSTVYVEGKLSTRSWTDKTSGQKRYVTEVVADNFQMLGGRRDDGNGQRQSYGQSQGSQRSYFSQAPASQEPAASWGDDDLPF